MITLNLYLKEHLETKRRKIFKIKPKIFKGGEEYFRCPKCSYDEIIDKLS